MDTSEDSLLYVTFKRTYPGQEIQCLELDLSPVTSILYRTLRTRKEKLAFAYLHQDPSCSCAGIITHHRHPAKEAAEFKLPATTTAKGPSKIYLSPEKENPDLITVSNYFKNLSDFMATTVPSRRRGGLWPSICSTHNTESFARLCCLPH